MLTSFLHLPDDESTTTILLGLLLVFIFIYFFISDSVKADLDLDSSHHSLLSARVVGIHYQAQSYRLLHPLSKSSLNEKLRFTRTLGQNK